MTRIKSLRLEFVNYAPEALDDGVLYVSIPFTTVVHRCCCGCGNEVVTPLDPTDWEMTFDGKSVSLSPSIGNWGLVVQHLSIEGCRRLGRGGLETRPVVVGRRSNHW